MIGITIIGCGKLHSRNLVGFTQGKYDKKKKVGVN